MQGDDPNTPSPEVNWQFKPGDTISPTPSGTAEDAAPSTEPTSSESHAAVATSIPETTSEPKVTELAASAAPPAAEGAGVIHWTASEFIAHHKSLGWYFALAATSLAIAAGIWLLTKDKISSGAILVAALALGAYGARKPRQLAYEMDAQGLHIGEKYYDYDQFRSFAVIPEGAFSSVVFMPLKRFAPLTTIYYEPADEDRIVELLADRLPLEDRQHDAIDRFLRRIRY